MTKVRILGLLFLLGGIYLIYDAYSTLISYAEDDTSPKGYLARPFAGGLVAIIGGIYMLIVV